MVCNIAIGTENYLKIYWKGGLTASSRYFSLLGEYPDESFQKIEEWTEALIQDQ